MNAVKECPPVIQTPYARIPLGPIPAHADLATQEMVIHVLLSQIINFEGRLIALTIIGQLNSNEYYHE